MEAESFEVDGMGHGVMGVLHAIAEEPVDLVEVDSEIASSKVGDFCVGRSCD